METREVSNFIALRNVEMTFPVVRLNTSNVRLQRNEMDIFILIISVPLFVIIVLLLSVFVLANYSGNEHAKGAPEEAKVPVTIEGADNVVAKE